MNGAKGIFEASTTYCEKNQYMDNVSKILNWNTNKEKTIFIIMTITLNQNGQQLNLSSKIYELVNHNHLSQ